MLIHISSTSSQKVDNVPGRLPEPIMPSSISILERDIFIRHFLGEGLKEQGYPLSRNSRLLMVNAEEEFGVSHLQICLILTKSSEWKSLSTNFETKHARQQQQSQTQKLWLIYFILVISSWWIQYWTSARCLFFVFSEWNLNKFHIPSPDADLALFAQRQRKQAGDFKKFVSLLLSLRRE